MYNQFNPYGMGMGGNIGGYQAATNVSRFSRINWSNILNNTQKTLGIINQTIPLVYQMKPLVSNAKTLFRIAGAMKEDKKEQEKEVVPTPSNYTQEEKSNLRFFL